MSVCGNLASHKFFYRFELVEVTDGFKVLVKTSLSVESSDPKQDLLVGLLIAGSYKLPKLGANFQVALTNLDESSQRSVFFVYL